MRVRVLLLGLVAAFLPTGCSRQTAVQTGTREQVLHLGNTAEPADLDPHTNTASSTSRVLSALFEGLVVLGNDGQTILPGAAERWAVSADGLTYTFHLRAGAVWSNGEPVTARDFRESFLRLLDPQLGCELASFAGAVVGAGDFLAGKTNDPAAVGVTTPDERTVVMRLAYPAPYWLTLISYPQFYPVNLRSVDAGGGRRARGGAWTRPGRLVGNGPFMLAEWRPNSVLRVVRNPRYWDVARVRLNEVRFYPTDDENSDERSYRAGQLHVTARLPVPKVAVYRRDHADELHLTPQLRVNFLSFNVARPPFTDPRVRRAFALAIDRERLVAAALGALGTPAFAMTRPDTGGDTTPPAVRFDPAESRRLLAEAGFPGGVGLPKIEFTLNGNAGRTLTLGEVLQNMWAENLGARVSVASVEFKVYLNAVRTKQFQLLLDGWGSNVADPRELMQMGVTDDPNNDSGWGNREFDADFAAADHAETSARRGEIFNRMEARLAQASPYAPLYYTNAGFLVRPEVRGWRDNALGQIDWRTLWLEAK